MKSWFRFPDFATYYWVLLLKIPGSIRYILKDIVKSRQKPTGDYNSDTRFDYQPQGKRIISCNFKTFFISNFICIEYAITIILTYKLRGRSSPRLTESGRNRGLDIDFF